MLTGCAGDSADKANETEAEASYVSEEFPLEREGIDLHLDCMKLEGTEPAKNILLIHGVTYSSHEFDINYQDYSLVRKLAREGYNVWRLDIAGFGSSEEMDEQVLRDIGIAKKYHIVATTLDGVLEIEGAEEKG